MRLSTSLVSILVVSLLSSPLFSPSTNLEFAPAALAAETKDASRQGYCRFPTIHGDQIAFCSEDDLWTVSTEGGTARRLTAGKGISSMPHFSPDGKLIAFVCTEEGNPEVYVMPSDGGTAKRLTHLGASGLNVCGWTPDGQNILFSTNGHTGFWKAYQLFEVSANGGMARGLNLGDALTVSIAKSGAVAIGRNSTDPARWKRYHGGTAGELWIGNSLEGNFKPLISLKGNLVWPQFIGDRVFFLSDHEGIGNIYSCKMDGADLKRHTKELEYYARFPSTDGKRIVYTAGAHIFVLDPAAATTREVNVVAPSNLTQAKRKFVEARDYLQEYAPHPKGHSVGLIVRGQPFIMPLFEGAVVSHGVGSKERYEQFDWLPDGDRFVVVSDAPGYHQIEIHKAYESAPPRVVTDSDIGRIISLSVAPTKNRLAFSNQKHELFILDYETKKLQKIDRSPADRIYALSWSPDGRWLAYSFQETISAAIIKIADAEDGSTHEVTSVVRNDYEPCFDPDGKYLYFLSLRDYNPVRDETQFDYSFPMATRPFLITLRKDVPSPLVPRIRPFIKDKDEDKDKDKDKAETATAAKDGGDKEKVSSKQKKKIPDVKIDFDGISGRILGLPVEQGNYKQIIALPKGKVLYTRFPVKPLSPHPEWAGEEGHQGVLASYDFDEQKETVIERDVEDAVLAADKQTLMYKSKKRLRVIDATKKADDSKKDSGQESGRESGWLDLNRVKVLVEPQAEWLQMYREAWRLQKEDFWVEDMSKVDWELVRKRYEALLPLVRTRSELSDLIWEMQGELGTSHAYESAGDYEPARSYRRGFLGADLSWDAASKGYRIDKIYRGDSWEPEADSPLAEPGLNIQEGDVIVQVGGHPVSEELSVDELLVDQAGQRVQLTIVPRPGSAAISSNSSESSNSAASDSADKSSSSSGSEAGGSGAASKSAASPKQRRLVVKTLKNESALRYRYWVERNRKIVHEMSKGMLGYVHIPDMGVPGFSEFHRGYLSEYRYPGLIVDIRYNGGGNVSSLLLEKLLRKRIGYGVPRYGLPEPYPYESIGGPMVALTNQFAGSDGDIFSHAFKQFKLGPLVGKRTWGGVIGISSSRKLVDGTQTTQPEFAFWFSDVGWKVENYGVDPDVVVENTPQDYRAGKDPQLDKAVELALEALHTKPFNMPEFIERPAKRLPMSLGD